MRSTTLDRPLAPRSRQTHSRFSRTVSSGYADGRSTRCPTGAHMDGSPHEMACPKIVVSPAVWSDHAQQHPQGGRLARAVQTDEAVDLARRDLQRDSIDGEVRTEALGETGGGEGGGHRPHSRARATKA